MTEQIGDRMIARNLARKAMIGAIRDTANALGYPPLSPAAVAGVIDGLAARGYQVAPVAEETVQSRLANEDPAAEELAKRPVVGLPHDTETTLDLGWALEAIISEAQRGLQALADEHEGDLRDAVSEVHEITHHAYRMVVNW